LFQDKEENRGQALFAILSCQGPCIIFPVFLRRKIIIALVFIETGCMELYIFSALCIFYNHFYWKGCRYVV